MSGPSIVGSAMIVYPVREKKLQDSSSGEQQGGHGGAHSPHCDPKKQQQLQPSDFPLRINYCPSNPCVTQIVHDLHRQILEGVEGAEVELNRYLTLCSFLEKGAGYVPEEAGSSWQAHLILDCLCGKPEHAIHVKKTMYRQQFRIGRRSRFLSLSHAAAIHGTAATVAAAWERGRLAKQHVPLHVPLQALIPPRCVLMHPNA